MFGGLEGSAERQGVSVEASSVPVHLMQYPLEVEGNSLESMGLNYNCLHFGLWDKSENKAPHCIQIMLDITLLFFTNIK